MLKQVFDRLVLCLWQSVFVLTAMLTWLSIARATAVTVTDNGALFPLLPIHIPALVDPGNNDVFPSGANNLYIFGIFDTGANIVAINTADATLLSLPNNTLTNIRLNGLGTVDPATLFAPIFAGQAQAQVDGITVGVRNVPTLIGAPVANNVLAFIDYSKTISRTYSFGTLTAPDITFFNAGAPGIPLTSLQLQLERFGTPGINAQGALEGQRYLLRNIVLSNGAQSASDQGANAFRFFYDSGTNLSIIGNTIAAALGLIAGQGTFDCFGGTSNGYILTSAVMTGVNGDKFTLNGARVCWQDSAIDTFVSPGVRVDAVIGQNFFDEVPHLFDGPGNLLGIGLALTPPTSRTPEASALMYVGFGLLVFVGGARAHAQKRRRPKAAAA